MITKLRFFLWFLKNEQNVCYYNFSNNGSLMHHAFPTKIIKNKINFYIEYYKDFKKNEMSLLIAENKKKIYF